MSVVKEPWGLWSCSLCGLEYFTEEDVSQCSHRAWHEQTEQEAQAEKIEYLERMVRQLMIKVVDLERVK